jgi:hypothetical protein
MRVPFLRRIFPSRRPALRTRRLTLEQLESRLVPSLTRLPDVLVNPGNPASGTDPNSQMETSYEPPAVAVAEDAAGDFVVVWTTTIGGSEDNGINVLAQRFNPVGQPLGGVITVAAGVSPETQNPIPAVGMDSAGDFVVAFDASAGIFASRYTASGTPVDTTPFQVDAGRGTFEDSGPSVALSDQGQFVITWIGFNSGGTGVFGATGSLTGPNPLNPTGSFTVASQPFSSFIFYQSASVSADAAGDFVVAYEPVSFFSVSSSSVYAQLYNPSAGAVGSPITLSTSGVATNPSAAMTKSGTFAVSWVEATQTPVLMAETFTLGGTHLAGPFAVSPAADPPSSQIYDTPAVASDAGGNFVAVWSVHGASDVSTPSDGIVHPDNPGSDPEPTGRVFAQTFTSGGTLSGGTIAINVPPNAPGPTAVAMDPAGEFVVAYTAAQQTQPTPSGPTATGNTYDIIAVIFRNVTPVTPPPTTPPVVPPPVVVSNTPNAAIATAFLLAQPQQQQEEENKIDAENDTIVVPPEPELTRIPRLYLSTPVVPLRDRLAVALIEQVGGTSAVGAISGKLFADLNGDGQYQPGKPPLAGRMVFLDLNNNGILDEGEPVAVTNSNGEYSFSGLSLRTYQVRQILASGDVQTLPAENNAYEVRLDSIRHDIGGRDFGNLYTQRRATPGRVVPIPAPPAPPPRRPSGLQEDDDGGEEPVDYDE